MFLHVDPDTLNHIMYVEKGPSKHVILKCKMYMAESITFKKVARPKPLMLLHYNINFSIKTYPLEVSVPCMVRIVFPEKSYRTRK
jgi:hypothetical protein